MNFLGLKEWTKGAIKSWKHKKLKAWKDGPSGWEKSLISLGSMILV
jgi:hypothetical protein